MLLREMIIGLRHLLGQEQAVFIFTLGLPQGLKTLGAQHLAKGIRRINCAINKNVHHMQTLRRVLSVQGLAE